MSVISKKKPIKNLKVGDKVKTSTLLKNNLVPQSKLMEEIKTWVVEEIEQSPITLRSGKKGTVTKRKTLVILIASKGKKVSRARAWWVN